MSLHPIEADKPIFSSIEQLSNPDSIRAAIELANDSRRELPQSHLRCLGNFIAGTVIQLISTSAQFFKGQENVSTLPHTDISNIQEKILLNKGKDVAFDEFSKIMVESKEVLESSDFAEKDTGKEVLVNPDSPQKSNEQLYNTRNQRMLVSAFFSEARIQEGWFTDHDLEKKINETPEMRREVDNLIKHYGAEGKVTIDDNTTIRDVIQQINALKPEGLRDSDALSYMSACMQELQRDSNFEESDKAIIADLQKRIDAQGKDEEAIRLLNMEENPNFGLFAEGIIERAEEPEYTDIGVMLSAGWASTGYGGHYIDVEVRKVGDRYQFVIANAGTGVENHTLTAENRGKTTKVFEVATKEEAVEIVRQIALMKVTPDLVDPARQSEAFYEIFKNAEVLSDSHIPDRPFQTGGNCALRSQKELMFYILQRKGMTDLANKVQDGFSQIAATYAQYPALKEEIARQGPKERIQPFESSVVVQGKEIEITPALKSKLESYLKRHPECSTLQGTVNHLARHLEQGWSISDRELDTALRQALSIQPRPSADEIDTGQLVSDFNALATRRPILVKDLELLCTRAATCKDNSDVTAACKAALKSALPRAEQRIKLVLLFGDAAYIAETFEMLIRMGQLDDKTIKMIATTILPYADSETIDGLYKAEKQGSVNAKLILEELRRLKQAST